MRNPNRGSPLNSSIDIKFFSLDDLRFTNSNLQNLTSLTRIYECLLEEKNLEKKWNKENSKKWKFETCLHRVRKTIEGFFFIFFLIFYNSFENRSTQVDSLV